MTQIRNATDADLPAVERLLLGSNLPVEGVAANFSNFLIAEDGEGIAGAIGLERFGPVALLRSAVVAPEHRGTGIGRNLVEELLSRAAKAGIEEVYLLTTSAEDYFPQFGFRRAPRSAVPEPLKGSAEFQGACPESATVMVRSLATA
jgi:N-acetylglutamate synthase-like GNAT family acetyltransferase